MQYKKGLCVVFFGFMMICRTGAQTQFSGWVAENNTVTLSPKLSLHADIQARSTDQLEHLQTFIARPGLNVHLHKKFIATGGYAFIHNRRVIDAVSGYAAEHRIWLQLVLNHALVFGKGSSALAGTMQHRLRAEQRYLPKSSVHNGNLVSDGRVASQRIRYLFRTLTPIVPWSAEGRAPFVAVQNEVMFNIGNRQAVNGKWFDQNRAYIALGYRFHRSFDAELGYMNQYAVGKGKAFTNNHILQLATFLRL